MYLDSDIKKECYGCMACVNACPRKAIEMEEGSDTYLYPCIESSLCVDCGLCRNVCPSVFDNLRKPLRCMVGVVKDKKEWERSSSGGAFKQLAIAIRNSHRDKAFYVCSCIWGGHFQSVHKVEKIENEEDINIFCKSKYVMSYIGGVYKEIGTLLQDDDNVVLFTGTPCQVAGLKSYLGHKGFDNLICIDLVCHGAPSQKMFDKYIEGLELQYGEICHYEFKNKERLDNGTIYTRSAKFTNKDGDKRMVTRFTDDYVNLFYTKSYHYRPSCYSCLFKQPKRCGDFTIGDAWNVNRIIPELNPMTGVSLITYNTPQTLEYASFLQEKMRLYEIDYNFAVENNGALREPENCSIDDGILQQFFADIRDKKITFHDAALSYIENIESFKEKNE